MSRGNCVKLISFPAATGFVALHIQARHCCLIEKFLQHMTQILIKKFRYRRNEKRRLGKLPLLQKRKDKLKEVGFFLVPGTVLCFC